MIYPPSLKYCHVRNRWVISWPTGWHRGKPMPFDCELLPEFAEQLALALLAGPPLPDADAEGMVQPARAEHMPQVQPIAAEALPGEWDGCGEWDEVWGLVEGVEQEEAA